MNYAPIEILRVFLALGNQQLEVGRLALIQRKIYFEYGREAPGLVGDGVGGE